MIITIDGPVATGKSTIARKLAEAIGFIYFDTGAMYRAFTYGILKHHIDISNPSQVEDFLRGFQLHLKIVNHEKVYFFEGENVTAKIRSNEVTLAVSQVSALKPVRDKLIAIQRELAVGVNAVFEGRDMGTVVFPDAALKIFLTGNDQVRAKRRFEELVAKYPEEAKTLTLEACLENLNKRDAYDSSREHSPLFAASDACIIDTSNLTIDQVVNRILECKDTVKARKPAAQKA